MKSIKKYFIFSAIATLIIGSGLGIVKYQESFSASLNNGRFFPTLLFVITLYVTSLIIGIKSKKYRNKNKNWSLKTLALLFAIQIPVTLSKPVTYEFNTAIAYHVLISKETELTQYWRIGSNGNLFFNTESTLNSYGINIIALLYFFGLIFIYKKQPRNDEAFKLRLVR